jgi:hypothetical protein
MKMSTLKSFNTATHPLFITHSVLHNTKPSHEAFVAEYEALNAVHRSEVCDAAYYELLAEGYDEIRARKLTMQRLFENYRKNGFLYKLCCQEAVDAYVEADGERAAQWAIRSLKYSVGILSPHYQEALATL